MITPNKEHIIYTNEAGEHFYYGETIYMDSDRIDAGSAKGELIGYDSNDNYPFICIDDFGEPARYQLIAKL